MWAAAAPRGSRHAARAGPRTGGPPPRPVQRNQAGRPRIPSGAGQPTRPRNGPAAGPAPGQVPPAAPAPPPPGHPASSPSPAAGPARGTPPRPRPTPPCARRTAPSSRSPSWPLQPGRQVHRVTDHRVVEPALRAEVAHQRLARVESNADVQNRQPAGGALAAHLLHLPLTAHGGASGPAGVVRLVQRRAEHGHDGVADDLVDGALPSRMISVMGPR